MDIKVIDHPHLVRRRGTIVNKDIAGFTQFMKSRDLKVKQEERIVSLESRIEEMSKMMEMLLNKEKNEN